MNNKPTGRISSGLRAIYLILKIALTSFVLFMAVSRCSLLASADSYTLTPSQTLALYGSSFTGSFYNKDTGIHQDVSFSCVGSTDNVWLPPGAPDGLNLNIQGWGHVSSSYQTIYNSHAQSAPFLIYSGTVYNYVYNNTNNTTLSFHFPISLNISDYSGMFLYSTGSRAYPHDISSVSTQRSSLLFNTSFSSIENRQNIISGNYASYMQIPDTGEYNYIGTVPDDNMMQMQFFSLYGDSSLHSSDNSLFTLSNLQVDLARSAGHVYPTVNTYCIVYFLIQCPTLESYSPPVVTTTTTPAVTTRSPYTGEYFVTTPQFTYDLSPLETNQLNQIRIQNEQLQYEAGVFDGINIIIQQLNDIYNRMVQSGEIPVDLVGGFDWSVNTDVQNYVNNAVTSFTMAQITPASYFDTPNNIYDLFGGLNWLKPFALVGAFSTAMGIFTWFVFRGRKGG